MYDNIGGKIKSCAMWFFLLGAVIALITGVAIMIAAENTGAIFIGLLVMIVGPIVAWVSSWLLYGFGELIDKACDIERNTRGGERKSEAQAKADSERINKIEKLRSQGLITEEEYQQAISKGQ